MVYVSVFFICIWDDYEIVNDGWVVGVENYNLGEGEWIDC